MQQCIITRNYPFQPDSPRMFLSNLAQSSSSMVLKLIVGLMKIDVRLFCKLFSHMSVTPSCTNYCCSGCSRTTSSTSNNSLREERPNFRS